MCLWTMGMEPLKIANGTISLRSGEGVASGGQGEHVAVARKRETWLSWRREGCGRVQTKAPCSLCSSKKDGERGSLHGLSLCSEVGGEVICERRDSWGRTGDLRAVETVWI